jgi:anti-sigma regulatory factor (Ser/Thr protein kinase)
VVLGNTVAAHASRIGLTAQQVNDLVLVVQELASNAVRHGAGHGRVLLWRDKHDICFQVTDPGLGRTDLHLRGHHAPPPTALGGRGLWLARQLTHHLDIHAGDNGTHFTARIHLRTPPPARQ